MLPSNNPPQLDCKLEMLPTEILHLIVSFIEPTDEEVRNIDYACKNVHLEEVVDIDRRLWQGKRALSALCATSRQLHARLLPHLYRRIYFFWTLFPLSPKSTPLGLLLRTLLTRPDIAGLVQDVRFDCWNMNLAGMYQVGSTFTRQELELLRKAIRWIVGSNCTRAALRDYLNEILANDSGDAIAAVAISLMSGLRQLSLVTAFYHSEQPIFLWKMMSTLLGDHSTSESGGHFSMLRHFHYNTILDADCSTWYLATITPDPSPLLRLSRLETLELYLSGSELERYPVPTGQTIPTLKRLKLATGQGATFRKLLSCFPGLVHLEITAFLDIVPKGPRDSYFRADRMREALVRAPFATTLKTLLVHCYWFSGVDGEHTHADLWLSQDTCGIKGTLGPLTELETLETLEISLHTLAREGEDGIESLVRLLPKSLKRLRLLHDLERIEEEEEYSDEDMADYDDDDGQDGGGCPHVLEELCAARGKGIASESVAHDGEIRLLEEVIIVAEQSGLRFWGDNRDWISELRFKKQNDVDLDTLRMACEPWGVKFRTEWKNPKGQGLIRDRHSWKREFQQHT